MIDNPCVGTRRLVFPLDPHPLQITEGSMARMKVVVWAEILANGFYPVNPTSFVTPDEVWADFFAYLGDAGNVILGRKTAEEVLAAGDQFDLGGALLVSVSRTSNELPGAKCVGSAREAIEAVSRAGHQIAFFGGGANLISSVLDQGLADELVVLIAPALGARNSVFSISEGEHRSMDLLKVEELGSGVVKLSYRLTDSSRGDSTGPEQ